MNYRIFYDEYLDALGYDNHFVFWINKDNLSVCASCPLGQKFLFVKPAKKPILYRPLDNALDNGNPRFKHEKKSLKIKDLN